MSLGLASTAGAGAGGVGLARAPAVGAADDLLETFDEVWSIVHRTHFDPEFNGVDWQAVRQELRPRAAAAESVEELRDVVRDMLGRLGQSHFQLIPAEVAGTVVPGLDDGPATGAAGRSTEDEGRRGGPAGGVGIDLRLRDGLLLVTEVEPDSPAATAGVRPGWALTGIGEGEAGQDGEDERREGSGEGEGGNDIERARGEDSEGGGGEGDGARRGGDGARRGDDDGFTTVDELLEAAREALASEMTATGGTASGGTAPGWLGVHVHRAALALLHGPAGTPVRLALRDGDDRPVELELVRARLRGEPVKMGVLPTLFARVEHRDRLVDAAPPGAPGAAARARPLRVGIIRFSPWLVPVVAQVDAAVDRYRDADGIVVDLRGNPGGVVGMISGIAGHFLDEPQVLGTMKTRDSELRIPANPRRVAPSGKRVEPFAGPLAILIDELSFSASEIFAAGMQGLGRARVFGTPSLGGVLASTYSRLPNGDVLQYAIADFVTASGQPLEGVGVTPDELTPLTREALHAGRDPALEAALEWIGSRAHGR